MTNSREAHSSDGYPSTYVVFDKHNKEEQLRLTIQATNKLLSICSSPIFVPPGIILTVWGNSPEISQERTRD